MAYDRMYRRQALANQSLDWSVEDVSLYNEASVGHAKIIPRCQHCLSEHHSSEVCPDMTQFVLPWGLASSLQVAEGPAQPGISVPLIQQRPPIPQTHGAQQGICCKFNENRCFMRRCRFLHICSLCFYPHPAVQCPHRAYQPGPSRECLPARHQAYGQNRK